MGLLLGIDYGTGGCKVTVLDESGAFRGEASTEFTTYHDHPGWSEQNPSDWWGALCASLGKLRAAGMDLGEITAIALDGSTHNAVLLSGSPEFRTSRGHATSQPLNPVRRTIMWTDQRATAECERLKAERGAEIFASCYQMPAPTWTLPQLMWIRSHEPDVLGRVDAVLFVKDYVRYLLTGDLATDYIEAEGTLMFSMPGTADGGELGAWNPALVELAGLRMSAMPRIVRPTDVVGVVTPAAAAATGLRAGTQVVCGTSDSAVEDYGAGAVEPGDMIVKLATAGNVNSMTAEAHPHPKTLTYSHVVPGMWYSVSATNAAALCQRWWRDNFFSSEFAARSDELKGRSPYEIMDEEASRSPLGAGGVFFHPYLQGERCPYWDANLRASFTGVSIASTRADFSRALMEGVAFSLRDCYRTLEEMELPVKRIFLIGGGARSKLWSRIVADVFNRTVAVPTPADASFGSCLLAGTGTGVFADVRDAVARCLKIDCEIVPDASAAADYASLFVRYRRIHDALASV